MGVNNTCYWWECRQHHGESSSDFQTAKMLRIIALTFVLLFLFQVGAEDPQAEPADCKGDNCNQFKYNTTSRQYENTRIREYENGLETIEKKYSDYRKYLNIIREKIKEIEELPNNSGTFLCASTTFMFFAMAVNQML